MLLTQKISRKISRLTTLVLMFLLAVQQAQARIIFQTDEVGNGIDVKQQIIDRLGTGLLSGGSIDEIVGTLTYSVNSGTGYVGETFVSWATFPGLTAPANQTSFIGIDVSGGLVVSPSELNEDSYILLGEITANATEILHQHEIKNDISKTPLNIINYIKETAQNIVANGVATSENSGAPKTLSVEGGIYYHNGLNRVTISAIDTSGADTFKYAYRSADLQDPNVVLTGTIDVNNFDDGSGILAPMTAGKWKKEIVLADPSDVIYVVYGQQEFDNRDDALNGPLPVMPTALSSDAVKLAALLVEQGTASIGTTNIIDIRPMTGVGGGAGGTFTSHSALSDLNNDDHLQYAKEAGTESISGSWTFTTNPALPGTTSDSFTLDSNDSSASPKLSFGSALTKFIEFDTGNDWFNISRRMNIAGQGGVNGIKITTRAGAGDTDQAQLEIRDSANASVFAVDEDGDVTLSGTVDGRDVSTDGSTLDTHVAATAAHGATGAVVGTTNTQTLTNKSIDTLNNATLTLDNDNVGAGVDIDIIANQGSDPDGILRYNSISNAWQISNDGGAFANISTGQTLDQSYDQGGAGAGRSISVDANPVRLDSTAGTNAPLELTPLVAAPTTGLSGGQLMTIDGLLYQYDSTRAKWLSKERPLVSFSRNTCDNIYADIGTAVGTNTGHYILRNATVTAFSVTTSGGNTTKPFHIRTNGNAANLQTLTLPGANLAADTTVNLDVTAGDFIQIFCDPAGNAASNLVATLELAWRP